MGLNSRVESDTVFWVFDLVSLFFPLPFLLWLIYSSLMTLWTLCVNESTTGQGFWTSRGMKTFPLKRKINLCISKEWSSASRGEGQVHAQQDQGDAASPTCSSR